MSVRTIVGRWRRYWLREVAATDLVVWRLVLVAIILGLRPVARYSRIGHLSPAMWEPVPILAWLGVPQPDATTATALAWITTALAVAVGLGIAARVTSAALVPLLLLEEAFVVSAGRVTHGTIPLLYAVALFPPALCTMPRAGWYLHLVYLELAGFYGGAAISKLLDAGWRWTDGYSLQFFLLEKGEPAGLWLAGHLGLCRAASLAVLVWQLAFVLGMSRRLRPILLAGGVLFHAGTTWFLGVAFWPVVALYALFVPWPRALAVLNDRRNRR